MNNNKSEDIINVNDKIHSSIDLNDSDSEGSRVKGSIKDRLIIFLYRNRLKIKLMKHKPLITKQRKITFFSKNKLSKTEISVIKDIQSLKELGKEIIDVDLKSEKFDFDKYDYYVIEPIIKKGIDYDNLKNIKESRKVIKDSKIILSSIKKSTKKISINLEYPYEHREDLNKIFNSVKKDVDKLKIKLALIPDSKIDKEKLNNIILKEDKMAIKNIVEIISFYEQKLNEKEEQLKIEETVSKVIFKKKIGVSKNIKREIKKDESKRKLSKSNDKIKASNSLKKNLKNKKIVVTKKDKVLEAFDMMKIRQIRNTELSIKKEITKTKDIVDKMNDEVSKVTKDIKEITKVTGYSNILKSCLKVATGILTLPFTGANIFNITLGSALINKGLHGLKKGLVTKSEVKINYQYEDLSEKIKKTKDKAKLTELLIVDSLNQIYYMKREISYINDDILYTLMKLEENLEAKLKEIKSIDRKLDKQDKKNKIKIKKVEKGEC